VFGSTGGNPHNLFLSVLGRLALYNLKHQFESSSEGVHFPFFTWGTSTRITQDFDKCVSPELSPRDGKIRAGGLVAFDLTKGYFTYVPKKRREKSRSVLPKSWKEPICCPKIAWKEPMFSIWIGIFSKRGELPCKNLRHTRLGSFSTDFY
jgi:hypothetical protein